MAGLSPGHPGGLGAERTPEPHPAARPPSYLHPHSDGLPASSLALRSYKQPATPTQSGPPHLPDLQPNTPPLTAQPPPPALRPGVQSHSG